MRKYHISEFDRDKLARKSDQSETVTPHQTGEIFPHSNVEELVKIIEGTWEGESPDGPVTYYNGQSIIYWPEDGYLEEMVGDEIFVRFLQGTPVVGRVYKGTNTGFTFNDLEEQIDVYTVVSDAYTDEQAQDAIAAASLDTNSIDYTYNDIANTMQWDVIPAHSITVSASGVHLVGDATAPGATQYYGTNAGGIKGWYALTSVGYTDEQAQDATAAMILDSESIGHIYDDTANTLLFFVYYSPASSLTVGPDPFDGVQLIGDIAAPGNSYYYGTSSTGTKGWYALTSVGYTDEQAQDAIGTISIDSPTVNFTYSDATPEMKWDVITQLSVTSDASGVKLSGDVSAPGATQYYGTNSAGTKGWYSIPSSSYTDEQAQDAVGAMVSNGNTTTVVYTDAVPSLIWEVKTQMSLSLDASGIRLVNDSSLPGNFRYYGTDGTGTKGFWDFSSIAYTDELAQDAIGGISVDTTTINFTYTDSTPQMKWDVITQLSITSDASGLKLSGDVSSPGATQYYGTNAAGVKGWYVLAGGGYTDEMAQDAIGAMAVDTTTINFTYTDATPEIKWDVITQLSITSDASGVKLVGDVSAPGNSYYYGTNSSGTKGWYLNGSAYTDEMAQDTIGAIATDTSTINVTYTDATPELKWDVITQLSVTSDGSGVKLVGDVASPSNSFYYGTNSAGTKGWFALPSSAGYTDEQAQDTIGAISTDTESINVVYSDVSNILEWHVRYQMSLGIDTNGLKLDGDIESPGNSYYYGTNSAGVKGWYASGATITVADTNSVDVTLTGSTYTWDVKVYGSIAIDTSGCHLIGDDTLVGGNKYYGTDAGGNRGWYAYGGGGGSYTDEMAQDAIGLMIADTNSVDVTYTDATPELKWDVRVQQSIAIDASGVKLSGDVTAPGNSYYYGTNSSGTKGWFVLTGGSSYTDEMAQDAIAAALVDGWTVDFTYNDVANQITAEARYQQSITADSAGLRLSGDSASPGNTKLYGTNSSGTKGWYDQPSGGTSTGWGILEGRLALDSTDPEATENSGGTLYYHPFQGDRIGLYTVGGGNVYALTTLSLALSGLTSNKMYDLFVYHTGSALALQAVAWTNDTTRATALVRTNGEWLKTGDLGKRYIGSFYNSTSTCYDFRYQRDLWNYRNQIERAIYALPPDDSHTYNVATTRAWNNSTVTGETRIYLVNGLQRLITAEAYGNYYNTTEPFVMTGIGIDSTSVDSSQTHGGFRMQMTALLKSNLAPGRHYLQLLQKGAAAGSNVFYGDGGAAYVGTVQSGLVGVWKG